MSTKSFTDTYVIYREDVNRFHNIMKDKKKVYIPKITGYKDVKDKKEIMEIIGINK